MKIRKTVDNPDSQFVAMPQTITPARIELNPQTEPIQDPVQETNPEIKNLEKNMNNKAKEILLKKR